MRPNDFCELTIRYNGLETNAPDALRAAAVMIERRKCAHGRVRYAPDTDSDRKTIVSVTFCEIAGEEPYASGNVYDVAHSTIAKTR